MSDDFQHPCSPKDKIKGLLYFPRLCDKIRLHHGGKLHPDLVANLGIGMDRWICQFLSVDYQDLKAQVLAGATDDQALTWAYENGITRPDFEKAWFTSYMKSRGFRDDLANRLAIRKKEDPKTDRDDILTFMDYIDVDEDRPL